MTTAQQQHNFTTEAAAQQSFDAAEYVVRITPEGVLVYEEVDFIVLDI